MYAIIMSLFGQTTQGIHLGFIVINCATVILLFLLGRRLINDVAAIAAAGTYAILSLSPSVLGFAAHATHFVALPAVAGSLLLLRAVDEDRSSWFFLSGLAISPVNRYGHEADVEHHTDLLLKQLRAGDGWKSMIDDRDLLKLLKLSPDDPEVHQQLAQFYAAKGSIDKAREHYHKAAGKYASLNPLYGAFVVLDHLRTLGKPMGLPQHLKAAEALTAQGHVEDAWEVLRPILSEAVPAALAERAHLIYLKACRALEKDEEASAALEQFRHLFPKSLRLREAGQVLTLQPDTIFPAPQPALTSDPNPAETDDEVPESKTLTVAACAGQIVTDPLFVFFWLAVTFCLSEFAWHISMQVMIFLAAFALTAFIRIDWTHAWRLMAVDEKSSRQEAGLSLVLNKASLAERGENYPKAAGLYEEVLQADPLNIQSRFNLARLYLDRLNDRGKAVLHLKKLAATAPPDHPYRQLDFEELRKSSGTA